jgi:hypothetical protein
MKSSELVCLLEQMGDDVDIQKSVIQFYFNHIQLICIFDDAANRMRIISPIAKKEEVSAKMLDECMNANFHTALDARYCFSEDVLYSAFIHPLDSLDRSLAISAVSQVASTAQTFGREYSGGTYIFGG